MSDKNRQMTREMSKKKEQVRSLFAQSQKERTFED